MYMKLLRSDDRDQNEVSGTPDPSQPILRRIDIAVTALSQELNNDKPCFPLYVSPQEVAGKG